MKFIKIDPSTLSGRQKEAYNFQKVSAVLADYGYQTIKLSDDWGGVDFIAQHLNGTFFKIQLKGRLTVHKKYEGKDIWMCFPSEDAWYLYPHDIVLDKLKTEKRNSIQKTYEEGDGYSFPSLSSELRDMLTDFKITPIAQQDAAANP